MTISILKIYFREFVEKCVSMKNYDMNDRVLSPAMLIYSQICFSVIFLVFRTIFILLSRFLLGPRMMNQRAMLDKNSVHNRTN